MHRRLCWFGLLGAATAVASGVGLSSRRPAAHVVAVPPLSTGAVSVARWVDKGLLTLAERELDTDVLAEPGAQASAASLAIDGGGATASANAPVFDGSSANESDDDGPGNEPENLTEQRERIYRHLSFDLGISAAQLSRIRAIVEASLYWGEGNPHISVHPMSRAECRERRSHVPLTRDDSRICGADNMVALYDPEREEPSLAKVCIDQYEFPNLPCEYPVVWVRANEAARICRILDKRLCDAHEWEGACAGKIRSPGKEYESWVGRQLAELNHNQAREFVWATGVRPNGRICATGALKSPDCVDASWEACGTNSFPAGAFPRCVSPFGVYDIHGNVAEHMSLPAMERQLGARGGSGETEMKGSWFAFDEYHPHPDDCRWRAPSWHATAVESELSHFNYHLGFRCCKDLE